MAKEDDPPPCGHCNGSGKIAYERPHKEADGEVTWRTSVEACDTCGGSGKCR
jgi:DnaJ-class molecular chaperone